MSDSNRLPTTTDRRPIDSEKPKLIMKGTWCSDLGDVEFSWFTTPKYERLAPMEEMLSSYEIGSRKLAREFLTKPHSLKIEGFEAGEFEHLIFAPIILPLEEKKSFWEAIEGRASKWAEGEFVICGIFMVTKEYFNKLPDFDQTVWGMCHGHLMNLSEVDALSAKLASLESTALKQ